MAVGRAWLLQSLAFCVPVLDTLNSPELSCTAGFYPIYISWQVKCLAHYFRLTLLFNVTLCGCFSGSSLYSGVVFLHLPLHGCAVTLLWPSEHRNWICNNPDWHSCLLPLYCMGQQAKVVQKASRWVLVWGFSPSCWLQEFLRALPVLGNPLDWCSPLLWAAGDNASGFWAHGIALPVAINVP